MTTGRAIVVGAGHNGLICAAYLARAGMEVTVLERRSSVGGCASTERFAGALVNICNCDHMLVRSMPIVDELRLAEHGLTYLDVEPAYLNTVWDGPGWFLFHDLERTLTSIAQVSRTEADNYRRYVRAALPVVEMIVELSHSIPTPGAVLKTAARQKLAAARAIPTLLGWSKRSVAEVVRSFFETDALQGPVVTTGPSVWGLAPDTPGTGLGALGYAMRHHARVGRPVGGSGALPDALSRAVVANGGVVRCDATVETIRCEGERVRGVRLVGGEELDASVVVVTGDPRAAFVEWLTNAPASAGALVERYRAQTPFDGYESKIDATLDTTFQPNCVDDAHLEAVGLSSVDAQRPSMVVSKSLDAIVADHALQRSGTIATRPQFFVQAPGVLDPTVAAALPNGHHVFSLEVLWTPYSLRGGWTGSDEPARWLRAVSELVTTPDQRPLHEHVVAHRHMGPLEYETQFAMPRGHAPSFAGTPFTALLARNPEQTRYRTPVDGLFLAGAATYPGAGIWGASGRNAATAVLRSRRRV